jgi:hypothetical protein
MEFPGRVQHHDPTPHVLGDLLPTDLARRVLGLRLKAQKNFNSSICNHLMEDNMLLLFA